MRKLAIVLLQLLICTITLYAQDRYPPQYLAYYQEMYDSAIENDSNAEQSSSASPTTRIFGPMYRGKSLVVFLGEVREITDLDMAQILHWQTAHKLKDLSSEYRRKVLVQECNRTYWVIMHDEQIQYLDNNEVILLYYYFIGGYSAEAVFLSIGFDD